MDFTSDDEKGLRAAKAIILNTVMNHYAVERVAFGYEKPNDKAPIDLYLKHLFFGFEYEPQMLDDVYGVYINEQGRISAEYDYDEYVHDLFVYQMESMFYDAPKDVGLECDGEEIPILSPFREYLFGILPLFAEVLSVEVGHTAFDTIETDKQARTKEYNKWRKFVTAILLDPLKSGDMINSYVKDIRSAPYYVNRLIENDGDNFYLKNIDVNSYEYAFALFSVMQFKNAENDKLLEQKMFEWERRRMAQ